MQIKCPKCSVSYDLPEKAFPKEKLDKKPQKVRCFKCKAIFTVALREKKREPTYEEFADILSRVDLEGDDMQQTVELKLNRPSAVHEPTAEERDLILDVFDHVEDKGKVDVESTAASQDREPSGLVSRTSLWTTDKTLDLADYTVGKGMMTIRRFALIAATVAVFLVIVLLLFIAGRNGWSLSFGELKEDTTYAFFGDPQEDLPPELQGLSVKVTRRRTIMAHDGRRITVVDGKVTNSSDTARTNVVLSAKIVDADDVVFRQTTAPCGKVRSVPRLQKIPKGNLHRIYKRGDDFFNCKVKPGAKRKFQLLFDDVPVSYQAYTLDVEIVAAKIAEPKLPDASPDTTSDE